MYPRRPHHKTRTGCATCKRRHVKCDGAKPECNNCISRGMVCGYRTANHPSPTSTSIASSSAVNELSSPSWNFSLQDLYLFQHFVQRTTLTLSAFPHITDILQRRLPSLAFKHAYIAHGVLALAAQHVMRLRDSLWTGTSLLETSTHHQTVGFALFVKEVQTVTSENAEALFMFSALVHYLKLGMFQETECPTGQTAAAEIAPVQTESSPTHLKLYVEWARLLRGINALKRSCSRWLHERTFSQLLYPHQYMGHENQGVSDMFEEQRRLTMLEERIRAGFANAKGDGQQQSEERVYSEAISELRKSFARARSGHPHTLYGDSPHKLGEYHRQCAYAWVCHTPAAVIDLIEQQRPESLVILAHWTILISRVPRTWYNESLNAQSVMKAIVDSLPDDWSGAVEWPKKIVERETVGAAQEENDAGSNPQLLPSSTKPSRRIRGVTGRKSRDMHQAPPS